MNEAQLMVSQKWDEHWSDPDPDRSDQKWSLYRRIVEMVGEIVEEKGNIAVCDLGCGPGELLDKLRRVRGVTAVGIDISSVAINAATERKHSAITSDAIDFTAVGNFDVMVSTDLLNHFIDGDERALLHWRATMREGGDLIVAVPDGKPYSESVLTHNIECAGFSKVTIERIAVNGGDYLIGRGLA